MVQLLPKVYKERHTEQSPHLHVRQQEVTQGARGACARRQCGARVVQHGHHRWRAPGCARAGTRSPIRRFALGPQNGVEHGRSWQRRSGKAFTIVSCRREAWRAYSSVWLLECHTEPLAAPARQGAAGETHRQRTAARRPRPRPPAAAARPARRRPWPQACSPGSRTPAAGHELPLCASLNRMSLLAHEAQGKTSLTMDDCRPTHSTSHTPRHGKQGEHCGKAVRVWAHATCAGRASIIRARTAPAASAAASSARRAASAAAGACPAAAAPPRGEDARAAGAAARAAPLRGVRAAAGLRSAEGPVGVHRSEAMSWAASEAARRPPHSASSCPGARAPAHRHAHTLLAALPHEAPRKGARLLRPGALSDIACQRERQSASPHCCTGKAGQAHGMQCAATPTRAPAACAACTEGRPSPSLSCTALHGAAGAHVLHAQRAQQGGPVPGARGAHHARAAVRGGRQRAQRACAQRPRWWRAAASRMRASTPPRQAATAPPAGSRPSCPPVAGSGRGQGRSHGSELAAQLSAGMGYPLARQCTPVLPGLCKCGDRLQIGTALR